MTKNIPLAVIILAAGKGSRMKSTLPKVMHPVAGRPMIQWLLRTAESLKPEKIIVVTAPDMTDVAKAVAPYSTVIQKVQKGTGDAVKPALEHLKNFKGKIIVLLGDEPFIDAAVLKKMIKQEGLSVMAVSPASSKGLGRMIVRQDGTLEAIVEEKECTPQQKKIGLCNAGNFCIPSSHLKKWLDQLKNTNKQKEFYLTDIPKIAEKDGFKTYVVEASCEGIWGINTRAELAAHEKIIQQKLRETAMNNGVTLIDPDTVYFSFDTKISQDVVIEPHVVFGPKVIISEGVIIHSFSHIEGAEIAARAEIGPFARIRPQSVIKEEAVIGNFVEVNRCTIGKKAKSKHMSYLGDATIGEKVNIGAGTVIANYDGFHKHQTIIGKEAFVGTNSTLVAPVTIGEGALIAAGSTITKNAPKNALAIGRARQENYPGWAIDYRNLKSGE